MHSLNENLQFLSFNFVRKTLQGFMCLKLMPRNKWIVNFLDQASKVSLEEACKEVRICKLYWEADIILAKDKFKFFKILF